MLNENTKQNDNKNLEMVVDKYFKTVDRMDKDLSELLDKIKNQSKIFRSPHMQLPALAEEEKKLYELIDQYNQKKNELLQEMNYEKNNGESLKNGLNQRIIEIYTLIPKIIEAKNVVNDSTSLFLNARPLLEVLPQLLGSGEEKRYLILFQNDKEIRPTGGFLTAYAIFTLERGRVISVTSGVIYFLDIDNRVPFYPAAPEWRTAVLEQSKEFIDRGVAGISST